MVSSLWNYAATCYGRPGVAEICLQAQDTYGADVNMLLAAGWLAARGCYWQQEDVRALAALCEDWRAQCLLPLRSVRRYLKQKTGADTMYAHAKTLELEAERHQLELMASALDETRRVPTNADTVLQHNMRAYFDTLLTTRKNDQEELLAKLCRLIGEAPLA